MVNWYQVGMLIFLALVVIGFTFPLIEYNNNNQPVSKVNYCQADSDCNLKCDNQLVAVLCYKNICQRNSCSEISPYNLSTEAINFNFEVIQNKQSINLTTRFNLNNIYLIYQEPKIKLYSQLSITYILDKFNLPLTGFKLLVNNQENYNYDYTPQEGDQIEVVY